MPNPKWRHSKRRKRARRTHYKAPLPTLSTCSVTKETHLRHHAYMHGEDLYYRGRVLVSAPSAEEGTGE